MASHAFLLILTVMPGAQSPASTPGLPWEIAQKIAAAVRPATEIALNVSAADGAGGERVMVRDELERALREHGINPLDGGDGLVAVSVSCGSNLRERACIAEIVRPDGGRLLAAVTRAHGANAAAGRPARLSLDARRVFGQRAPILDIALSSDRLLVLDPAAVTMYRRNDGGWLPIESRAVSSSRPWPRDVRGRLHVQGTIVDALLPGLTCRTDVNLTRLSCTEDRRPWPLDVENTGIDPSRNFFTTPDGLPFYAAAPVEGADPAGPRWLIADPSGALTFLDASRRALATAGRGDDVVALRAPCGGGAYALVSLPRTREGSGDALRLFRLVERELVPAAPPLELPGSTTALWAGPDGGMATVVTHDPGADRYDVYQVGIACDR